MKVQSSKPYFSVVIPLYNKERHILATINSVIQQSFQDFEVVVVNDGSTDGGAEIVKGLSCSRVRLIDQENAGVSVARNRGVKESFGEYIAFLDADDLWLENHLENLHKLINKHPGMGLYACAYRIRRKGMHDDSIVLHGLDGNSNFVVIANYFDSVAYGDLLVWSSAVCIPKKVFIDNDIWFPVGERYGEDQYVWARIAVEFEIAYCKIETAIYDQTADNNTISAIQAETEPHNSFFLIKDLRGKIRCKEKLSGFDMYVSKIFHGFPLQNILNGKRLLGLKQAFKYNLRANHRLKLIVVFMLPTSVLVILKRLKKAIANVK